MSGASCSDINNLFGIDEIFQLFFQLPHHIWAYGDICGSGLQVDSTIPEVGGIGYLITAPVFHVGCWCINIGDIVKHAFVEGLDEVQVSRRLSETEKITYILVTGTIIRTTGEDAESNIEDI